MKPTTIGWLLGAFVVAVVNWQFPFVRLANHWANGVVAILATGIPLVLLGAAIAHAMRRPNLWGAVLLSAGLLVLSMPFLVVVVVGVFSLPPHVNAQDNSFEEVARVSEYLAVYRTNGGATTAYGIVVRQEQPVFPGILLVRNVFSRYPLEHVACQLSGPRLTIRQSTSGQVLQEITLKRFLYF